MKVPYFDLSHQTAALRPQLDAAIKRVIDSGVFVSGPEVEAFESEWAGYVGTKYAVAVNSGTAALHLALLGAGVGPGDKVIVPAMSFIATAEAVSHCGATPVFVDIDPLRWTICPAKVADALEDVHARAILPVHLYGQPADMEILDGVSSHWNVPIIEDACQAHGAAIHDKNAGTFGAAAAFSFYPGKNLGAFGEGGVITTDSSDIARQATRLRSHGAAVPYQHDSVGFNYRMEELQAVVLRVKLPHLAKWNGQRARIAEEYREALRQVPELRLQYEANKNWPSNHLFVVQHARAKEFRESLANRGVGTSRHYPVPLHLTRAYAHLGYKVGDFPNAERLARECVSLPIWPEMTDAQVEHVIDSVKAFA